MIHHGLVIQITIYKRLYLYKDVELKRGWAYNTSWAYNTYYMVPVKKPHTLQNIVITNNVLQRIVSTIWYRSSNKCA